MSPTLLVIAAVLLAALGVLHSILGERLIIRSLVRRDDLPPVLGGQAYTAGSSGSRGTSPRCSRSVSPPCWR